MDNLFPIRSFMVIPGTGQRLRAEAMPIDGRDPVPRRSTAQCLAHMPAALRPVNDDQPTPPRAA